MKVHANSFSEMLKSLTEEGKRWSHMDVASAGAVALEDLAIESVAEWAGTAQDFGKGVWHELFTDEHLVKDLYLNAASELYVSSLLRNDVTGLMVALVRMATVQWFLRQAFKKYGK